MVLICLELGCCGLDNSVYMFAAGKNRDGKEGRNAELNRSVVTRWDRAICPSSDCAEAMAGSGSELQRAGEQVAQRQARYDW